MVSSMSADLAAAHCVDIDMENPGSAGRNPSRERAAFGKSLISAAGTVVVCSMSPYGPGTRELPRARPSGNRMSRSAFAKPLPATVAGSGLGHTNLTGITPCSPGCPMHLVREGTCLMGGFAHQELLRLVRV
jgi:hypothetical protein